MFWLTFLAFDAIVEATVLGLPRDFSNTTAAAGTGTGAFNLSSYCNAQRTKYFATYNPTGSYTTSTITDYIGFDDTGEQTGDVITQYYSTRTITFTEEAYQAYQLGGAKPPCCYTCYMRAGTIEFFWWPGLATATATATASKSFTIPSNRTGDVTAMGSNGFIFTSPSVYMAFSSLYAKNWCGTVGDVWYNTTIGFHPSEISTINPYSVTFSSYYTTSHSGSIQTVWNTAAGTRRPPSPLNYADLAQNCSTISGYAYFPDDPQNDIAGGWDHDPCHPILEVPRGLINMQQAWKDNHCTLVDGYGAYDPPIALTAAPYAAAPTLPAQPGGSSTPTLAPATSSYTALPDSQSTESPSSSATVSETIWIVGGGTYASPMIQVSETELDVATGTSVESETSRTATRLFKPHQEVSETELAVESSSSLGGGGVNRPIDSTTATYTVVQGTTDDSGKTAIITLTTEIVRPAQTAGANPRPSKTVIEETTLANGDTTLVTLDLPETVQTDVLGVTAVPVITIAGSTFTANAASEFIIGGITLSSNGAEVTIDNTPVAILPGGTSAVIGSSTVSLANAYLTVPASPSITLGGSIVSENTAGAYIVAPGTTLSIGGPSVTVDGTAYALKTDSAGQTLLVAGAASSTPNVAGYIMSAIGQMASSASEAEAASHSTTSHHDARTSTASGSGPSTTTASSSAHSINRRLTAAAWFLFMVAVAFSRL